MNLLKNKDIVNLDVKREKFFNEYIKKKNWDKENLTPNQLLEIVEHNLYRNP